MISKHLLNNLAYVHPCKLLVHFSLKSMTKELYLYLSLFYLEQIFIASFTCALQIAELLNPLAPFIL